jgi:hypothetical protein
MLRTLRDAFIAVIVERSVNWLVPSALPYAWTAILLWLTWDVLRWGRVRKAVARAYSSRGSTKLMLSYAIVFVIGGGLACGYWWGSNKVFSAAWFGKVNGKESTPAPNEPSTSIPSSSPTVPASDLAPNLHQQYLTDYKGMKLSSDKTFQSGTAKFTINVQVNLDYESKSKFLSIYIPRVPSTYDVCRLLPELVKTFLTDVETVTATSKMPGDPTESSSQDMIFTGAVYIYYEDHLTLEQLGSLESLFKAEHLFVHFRGTDYATSMWLGRKAETPKLP